MRKTVLIPASGIKKLQNVLDEVSKIVNNKRFVLVAFDGTCYLPTTSTVRVHLPQLATQLSVAVPPLSMSAI